MVVVVPVAMAKIRVDEGTQIITTEDKKQNKKKRRWGWNFFYVRHHKFEGLPSFRLPK